MICKIAFENLISVNFCKFFQIKIKRFGEAKSFYFVTST